MKTIVSNRNASSSDICASAEPAIAWESQTVGLAAASRVFVVLVSSTCRNWHVSSHQRAIPDQGGISISDPNADFVNLAKRTEALILLNPGVRRNPRQRITQHGRRTGEEEEPLVNHMCRNGATVPNCTEILDR
ncbi:hypothetical protein POX_f07559 [Penicillium oxalicum]|uniref:Uncharacterized protein n=1 Tax=Penicillium oxalicum (strain 114-2 / CGMCC 5302) TaxID=933388 RepID=S7ZIF6_PENO1|nr:hypothetical protein POX_f07559 [Penicillium oxalicum]EPS28476.1 hypothetical protein PDE_03422 [Penicillium oxalicum 114-2]KAI2787196.1 hypothetical protein POX_f07559 [Penicillium oxalicum]